MRFLLALLPLSLVLASCASQETVSEINPSPDELTLALERYASMCIGESDFVEALTVRAGLGSRDSGATRLSWLSTVRQTELRGNRAL